MPNALQHRLFLRNCNFKRTLSLVHWIKKLQLQMVGRLIIVGEIIFHEALFVAFSMIL
jgi:hypothetical protein